MTMIDSLTSDEAPVEPSRSRGGLPLEAIRYFAASLAALALDAAFLWIATRVFGLVPWIAGAIGYAAGLAFIYLVSVRWVFSSRTVRDPASEFVFFAALGVVGLVLNSTTLHVATSLGLGLPIAKAISAGIGFVANFASRKVLLFSRAGAPVES